MMRDQVGGARRRRPQVSYGRISGIRRQAHKAVSGVPSPSDSGTETQGGESVFCKKCGKPNPDEATVCSSCSAPLTRPGEAPLARLSPVRARTSGLAIASLVLGVLAVPALVGLVLGIIALVQIGQSRGRLRGQGLAIAGICVSAFMLVSPFLFLPLFRISRSVEIPASAIASSRSASAARYRQTHALPGRGRNEPPAR